MAIRITVEYRGIGARGINHATGLKSDFDKAIRLAMRDVSVHWRDKYMPRHFEPEAYSRYKYAKRTIKHEKAKWQKYGHRNPLEFTGLSKARILGFKREPTVRRVGREGSYVGKVPFFAPKHFFQYNKSRKFIDKPEELTRTSDAEAKMMTLMLDRLILVHLEKLTGKSRRRLVG